MKKKKGGKAVVAPDLILMHGLLVISFSAFAFLLLRKRRFQVQAIC